MDLNVHMLTDLVVWYAVFLFSTTFHEAMHAYASRYGGDNTAHLGGQTSLNPVPHIRRSPFGMVLMPLITFILSKGNFLIGWAATPFNIAWAARYPKRSFLMSLAGPFAHLIILIVCFVGIYIGMTTGFFDVEGGLYVHGNLAWALAKILSIAMTLNLVLLVFNLLPVPPLDGSEVWYLLVKKEEDRLRLRYQAQSYNLIGLMLAWWLFPKVFWPVSSFVYGLLSWLIS